MAKNLWKIEPRDAPKPGGSGEAATAASSPLPVQQSVGVILRERREERGEDLRYVAQMLRIRYPYLRAIEEGLIDDLPGPTYAIGFVRTYAEHLGLDAADMVVRFKAEVQGLGSRNDLNFPAPIPEGKIPSGAILLVGIIVAALIYAIWIYVSSGETVVSRSAPPPAAANIAAAPAAKVEPTPPVAPMQQAEPAKSAAPAETAEPVVADKKAAVTAPAVTPEEKAPAAPPTPKVTKTAETPETPKAETAEIAAPPPPPNKTEVASTPAATESTGNPEAAARESRVYGQENSDARIVLHAVADSWVEIRDKATDEILFTRVLFKGDSYRVPNRDGLSLLTGNAGGLRITVDGKEIAPIGRVGAVRRDFALEPKALVSN